MRLIALCLVVLATALAACGGETNGADDRRPPGGDGAGSAAGESKPKPLLPPGRGHILARVRRPVLAYDRPDGKPLARLRRTTPFGKPRTLGVMKARRKGTWLAVHSPVFGNSRLGWIANDPRRLRLRRTRVWLGVNLATKRVALHRHGRVTRRFSIAIGQAGTSTPAGRFQVTDKMKGSRFPRAPYGCCILALSARQPNLPAGWPGGDRIALHGTPLESTIGSAASNGCLRASDRDMRALMRRVPVGARVVIRG